MGRRKLFWLRRELFAMGNVSYLLRETYMEIYPEFWSGTLEKAEKRPRSVGLTKYH